MTQPRSAPPGWRPPDPNPNPNRQAGCGKVGRAVALLLGCLATASCGWAQTPPADVRAQALLSCPSIEEEIVDLDMLADGLRNTRAVSLLEKVRLKSAIDGLIDRMEAYHRGERAYSMAQLQQQYDLLLMRIAAHLQHRDELLHGRLCNAWEPNWRELSNSGNACKSTS